MRKLRLLERRVGRSGKDSCDYPRNGTDDYANAACGAIYLCQRVKQGWVRVGAIDFAKTRRVFWHDEEPERPRLRIVNISEQEALKEKMK